MRELLRRLVDTTDPTRDLKLTAFGLVVVFGIVKLAANDITDAWVNAWYGLCALVGLGGLGVSAVEAWKGTPRS